MTYESDTYATHPRPHSIPPPPPPQTPRARHARQDILRASPRPPVDADPHSNAVAAELVRSISRVLTTVDEERRVLVEAQERRREAEVENAALRAELNLERVLRLRTEAELRRLRHNVVPSLPGRADFERARALREWNEPDRRGASSSATASTGDTKPPPAPNPSAGPDSRRPAETLPSYKRSPRWRKRWRLRSRRQIDVAALQPGPPPDS
jgi:hypothetical protein